MAYKGGVPVNSGFYPRNDFPIVEAKDVYVSDEQRLDVTIEELRNSINGMVDAEHNHDDRYYTEAEIDTQILDINTSIENITDGSVTVKKAEHADEADHATMATQDASGNVIIDTYETKTDANAKLEEAKSYADSAAEAIKNDLLNGAGDAYDTLKELGDLIDENHDAIEALESIATGKADAEHNHDDVYYTESEINEKVNVINDSIDQKSQVQMVTSGNSEFLPTLKIHRLTQAEYDQAVANGTLDRNAIYLTPDEEVDLTPYATVEQLNTKADVEHEHSISDITDIQAALDEKVPVSRTINGKELSSNIVLSASDIGAAESTHTHDITKEQIGLDKVDNTSDAEKPISNATQAALDGKADSNHTHEIYAEVEHVHNYSDLLDAPSGVDIYVQDEEPADTPDGVLWVDLDADGDDGSSSSTQVLVDTTLTQAGQAADAKVVGTALAGKQPVGDYAKTSDVTKLSALVGSESVAKQIADAMAKNVQVQIVTWEADD